MGDLGFSDQRKIVMTGEFSHSVFVKDGLTKYSMSIDGGVSWTQPIQLDPTTGVTQRSPCVAVYEESDPTGQEFSGQAAIAVTWVDVSSSTDIVAIKMRTREFDLCKGQWNEWSPIYTINTQSSSTYPSGDDGSTPVIAPHLVLDPSSAGPLPQTWLLGWTITWTGPPSGGGQAVLQSRTILRSDATDGLISNHSNKKNKNWGQYPTSAILVPSSGVNPFSSPQVLAGPFSFPLGFILGFPSVVNAENKTPLSPTNPLADHYAQDIVVTSTTPLFAFPVSSAFGSGVFAYRAYYDAGGLSTTGQAMPPW